MSLKVTLNVIFVLLNVYREKSEDKYNEKNSNIIFDFIKKKEFFHLVNSLNYSNKIFHIIIVIIKNYIKKSK